MKKNITLNLFRMACLIGGITLISMALSTGCSHPVGTDCDESFLMVESATETMNAQPSISLMNIGDETVFVSGIGFVLRADNDLTVETPPGCTSLYEDMVDERILRISCFGDAEIVVPPNQEVIVDINVQGPWIRLDLISITATDENGDIVWNSLSGSLNLPAWNNPDYN